MTLIQMPILSVKQQVLLKQKHPVMCPVQLGQSSTDFQHYNQNFDVMVKKKQQWQLELYVWCKKSSNFLPA